MSTSESRTVKVGVLGEDNASCPEKSNDKPKLPQIIFGFILVIIALVAGACFWYYHSKISPIENFNYYLIAALIILIIGIVLLVSGYSRE